RRPGHDVVPPLRSAVRYDRARRELGETQPVDGRRGHDVDVPALRNARGSSPGPGGGAMTDAEGRPAKRGRQLFSKELPPVYESGLRDLSHLFPNNPEAEERRRGKPRPASEEKER